MRYFNPDFRVILLALLGSPSPNNRTHAVQFRVSLHVSVTSTKSEIPIVNMLHKRGTIEPRHFSPYEREFFERRVSIKMQISRLNEKERNNDRES